MSALEHAKECLEVAKRYADASTLIEVADLCALVRVVDAVKTIKAHKAIEPQHYSDVWNIWMSSMDSMKRDLDAALRAATEEG